MNNCPFGLQHWDKSLNILLLWVDSTKQQSGYNFVLVWLKKNI
jgi:hypothetical protein